MADWAIRPLSPGAPTPPAPDAVDYDPHFRRGDRLFGQPVPAFVRFFAQAGAQVGAPPMRVLDLGCGQGRHALLAARHGHVVIGVDLAATGIAQMLADAAREGMSARVHGRVGDITAFTTRQRFGVIVLARVLCHLPNPGMRLGTLERLAVWTRRGGHALVADSVRNRGLIYGFFASHSDAWEIQHRRADVICARRR